MEISSASVLAQTLSTVKEDEMDKDTIIELKDKNTKLVLYE